MKFAIGACLAGIAGVWGWALFWDKPMEPLETRFVGEFVLDSNLYVPPKQGNQENPYPPHQKHRFSFFADGRYKMRIIVNAGYEMWRQEGQVELRDGLLILRQISVNREAGTDGPWRYKPIWGQDRNGEFLRLREVDRGYELVLRRSS